MRFPWPTGPGRARRLAASGLLVSALALGLSAARADSFRWKDGRAARGRILAEFRDLYYVQLESELARFVSARELDAILDDADRPRADLGRGATAPPLLAVDNVVGTVTLQRKVESAGAVVQDVAFAAEGDRVETGEAGLARLAFPSIAVARLGAQSAVVARASTSETESLELERGDVFVATDGLVFEVVLGQGLRARARSAVFEVARQSGTRSWRVASHRGHVQVEGETFRVDCPPGLAAVVERAGTGFKVTAEGANTDAIEVAVGAQVSPLPPGQSISIGAAGRAATSGAWRLSRVTGGVLVRLGGSPSSATPPVPVSQGDAEHVLLDVGDAVLTEAKGEAILTREDGATVTLAAASALELAACGGDDPSGAGAVALDVRTGAVRVEALHGPVVALTPCGESRLAVVAAELRRPRSDDETAIELTVTKNAAALALPAATLTANEGTHLVLEGTPDAARLHVSQGEARVVSHAQAECVDQEVSCSVAEGRDLGVNALHQGGISFDLAEDRTIAFGPERVGASLLLGGERPKVVFQKGPECELQKGLHTRFGFERGFPQARFKGGERILLADSSLKVLIENPTVVFPDGTTVAFKDAVSATLRGPDGLAGAVVGARTEDRIEVPPRTRADVGRRGKEHGTFALADGRRVWIHDGAPAVQGRLAPERALALTMPGTAPLTIAAGRSVNVLATREGEFVILDDASLRDAVQDLDGVRPLSASTTTGFVYTPVPDHIPELLNEPPPASPTRP